MSITNTDIELVWSICRGTQNASNLKAIQVDIIRPLNFNVNVRETLKSMNLELAKTQEV